MPLPLSAGLGCAYRRMCFSAGTTSMSYRLRGGHVRGEEQRIEALYTHRHSPTPTFSISAVFEDRLRTA